MQILYFPANQIYTYQMTGKFEAPSDEWTHIRAPLAEYELFVITEGTLYLKYGRDRFTVNEGEYLILPPSEFFRQGFKPSYCAFYWLHFSFTTPPIIQNQKSTQKSYLLKGQIQSQNHVIQGWNYVIPQQGIIPKLTKLIVLLRQLQDQVNNEYPPSVINITTTSVVSELCGQLFAYPVAKATSLKNQKQIYAEIMNYVKMNVHKKLTASDVSQYFGYNRQYLSKRFRDIAGVSLKEYILQQKIEAANFLLTDTNTTITDIALQLGFSNVCNFSRTYKHVTGFTPVQYRESYDAKLINNI